MNRYRHRKRSRNRPALPEERGHDCRPEPPTLDELRRTHDWRSEERAEGQYVVDVCEQCGYEESARHPGQPLDCEVHEIPERAMGTAERLGLVPEEDEEEETEGIEA